MNNQWLAIGKIGKPRGLRGEFFLSGRSAPLEWDCSGLAVVIGISPENGVKTSVSYNTIQNERDLLKLDSLPDRTAVERLAGQDLWLEDEDLEGDSNLLDRVVVDREGQVLGKAFDFLNFGGVDNLEIHNEATDSYLQIPFVDEYVSFETLDDKPEIVLNIAASDFAEFWYKN